MVRHPIRMARSPIVISLLLCFPAALLLGCSLFPTGGTISGPNTPGASRQVVFDGPVTFRISAGEGLPGTNIAYVGKLADGRANVTIAGQTAPKKAGDSLNWSGAPVPFSLVALESRVVSFDDGGINLIGTVNVTIQNPNPQAALSTRTYIAEFSIPITYNLNRNQTVQGTTLQFIAKTPQGAQFAGLEGYPYRQQFDSVVWDGYVRERIYMHLDTRMLSFSDTSATLGGTLAIRFE